MDTLSLPKENSQLTVGVCPENTKIKLTHTWHVVLPGSDTVSICTHLFKKFMFSKQFLGLLTIYAVLSSLFTTSVSEFSAPDVITSASSVTTFISS